MIEDGFIDKDLSLASPVPTMRKISHDPTCRTTFSLADGSSVTAVELQWEFFRLAQKYADEIGLDSCGDDAQTADLLRRWEQVLTALEADPTRLDGQLDWVTKYNLLDAYAARNGLEWGDPKLALMDLQYHDVRPERSLYEKLVKAGKVERLLDEDEVVSAITEPPASTRAYFRGRCLSRWSDSVVAANWDSMIFDLGADPLKRIPMMEPLRGTKAHVDELLDGCATPAELVARLSA
jgi:proteasome accessory factor A